MYGLLLESVQFFIKDTYGEDVWDELMDACNIDQRHFITHQIYSDSIIVKIAQALAEITETESLDDILMMFGKCFVQYFSHFGFDKLIRIAGRDFSDLLHSIDEIHYTMKYTFPRMQSPLFYIENETDKSIDLVYQSQRRGFAGYIQGQLLALSKTFYQIDIEIQVIDKSGPTGSFIIFRIYFDNLKVRQQMVNEYHKNMKRKLTGQFEILTRRSSINSLTSDWSYHDKFSMFQKRNKIFQTTLNYSILAKIFPFHLIIDRDVIIRGVGRSIARIFPFDLYGQYLLDQFNLQRPALDFDFPQVISLSNYILYELETKYEFGATKNQPGIKMSLKGQMKYIDEWECLLYIGGPKVNDLDELKTVGLYLNDLSLYDLNRSIIMEGNATSKTLQMAFANQICVMEKLQDAQKFLYKQSKQTDKLLSNMLPRHIALKLKQNENIFNSFETYNHVSILFVKICQFEKLVERIKSPQALINEINQIYKTFDFLVLAHDLFKVETKADSSYMVVSGIQESTNRKFSSTSCLSTTSTMSRCSSISNEVLDQWKAEKFEKRMIGEYIRDLNITYKQFKQRKRRLLLLNCSEVTANLALEMVSAVKAYNTDILNCLKIKVGFHSGSIVAAIVGLKTIQYCLVGDTVNVASRMTSLCDDNRVMTTYSTALALSPTNFRVTKRGAMEVKGKGTMDTYWVDESFINFNEEDRVVTEKA
ncbi:hypothetical protein SNEBB_010580 [Seison nebaliae]|nr:hypothetical protein SNEBB_010580 [Seison nebaliae]